MKTLPAIFYIPARFSQVYFCLNKNLHVIAIFTLVRGLGMYRMKTNPYFSGLKKDAEQAFSKLNSNSFFPSQQILLKTTKTSMKNII